MTDLTDRARGAVYAAIDALNEQLPEGHRLKKMPETALLSRTGGLDSVSFINLVVLVEEKCQDECEVSVSLTDDLDSGGENPFETIGSFIDHVCRLMDKETSYDS